MWWCYSGAPLCVEKLRVEGESQGAYTLYISWGVVHLTFAVLAVNALISLGIKAKTSFWVLILHAGSEVVRVLLVARRDEKS